MKTRKYLISLFCVIMVVAMAIGIVGCTKINPAASEINGEYYCDTQSGEYTVTLKDGKITLKQGDKVVEGSYDYDKTNFTVKFKGNTTGASGEYTDGVLKLTYNGATYSYLKKVEYTVKFMGDGNEIAGLEQKVVNGRTATQPADPTAPEGKKFLTWYADAELTKIYNFATRITSDATIYARYVDYVPGEEVFNVKLVCEGESYEDVKTIGQIAYNLPTPVKAGSVFAGWFVSQYDDATKLSYKYAEQKIAEDITLYAKFVENAADPVIEEINENGVTWKSAGINKNYVITIINDDTDVKLIDGKSVATLSYKYDFSTVDAGNYVIELAVDGKTTKAYYKNKALARVSHFEVLTDADGNELDIISWNAIDNAEKYILNITCGDATHDHFAVEITGSTQYNFENCAMKEGGIEFVVKAVAKGYITSESVVYKVDRTLEKVGGYAYAGDYVTWTAVKGATSYEVTIVVGTKETKVTVEEAKVYVGDLTGKVTVKVKPLSRKYNSADETSYEFDKATLAAPSDVKISVNTISWSAVTGATSYIVKIGDKEIPVANGTSYTVTEADIVEGKTEYEVSVKTVASDATKNSGFSTPIKATYGKFVTAPVYKNKVVAWDVVLGAASYGVKIDTAAEVKITDGTRTATTAFDKDGKHTVVVTAYKADGTTKLDSTTLEVNVYKLVYDVTGGVDVKATYYYADTDVMTITETTERYGYDFSGWYNAATGDAKKYQTGDAYDFGKNASLYARWTPKTYTVTLDLDGKGEFKDGTYNPATGISVKFGEKFELPVPDTTKVVSTTTFKGWYTEAYMAGFKYTNEKGVSSGVWSDTKDMKLFAGWAEILSFKPVYDPGSGKQAYSVSQGKQIDTTTEVEIPATYLGKPVTIIEGNAFYNNRYLKKLIIPNTIQTIELGFVNDDGEEIGSAFSSCTKLAELEMKEVDVADIEAKYGVNLQEFVDSCKYTVSDGVLLYDNDYNGKELKYIPVAKTGEYTVPVGVETLPINIFKKKTSLTKITIPYTVTSIAKNAFNGASGLKSVVFEAAPEGQTAQPLNIDVTAFTSCSKIEIMVLPSRLAADTDVYTLLKPCSALTDIDVVGAGGNFCAVDITDAEKDTLKSHLLVSAKDGAPTGKIIYAPVKMPVVNLVIDSSVTEIGDNAFNSNKSLGKITIDASVKRIGVSAFDYCKAITSITLKEDEADNVPLEICDRAFYYCNSSSLKEIVIPARTTTIGEKAFYSTKFEKITFKGTAEDNLSIGAGAFSSNSVITSLVITPNIKKIDTSAFSCSKLVTVTLNTETEVDYAVDVFSAVTTVNIGEKAHAVEINGVFGMKVKTVNIDEKNTYYLKEKDGTIFDTDKKKLLLVPADISGVYEVPDTVEFLGANVFKSKSALTKVVLGENVSYIGAYTFSLCSKLATIEFKAGGTAKLVIADRAFNSCGSLTSLVLPERTESIGEYAFAYCGQIKTLIIPEGVKTIGDKAFIGCSSLETVSIPSTVTSMGDCSFDESGNVIVNKFSVFNNCKAITSINVASGNPNYFSKDGVLYTKKNGSPDYLFYVAPVAAGNVVIPNTVTSIAKEAFKQNANVTAVSFGGALTGNLTIGESAFYQCKVLTSVTLPAGVTEIGRFAFYQCAKLESLVIPNTVTFIGSGAFTGDSDISSVTFDDGGDTALVIEDSRYGTSENENYGVFAGCSQLTTVTFPNRAIALGSCIFKGCTSLTSVEIKGDVTALGKKAFEGCKNLTTVVGFDNITTMTELPDYFFAYTKLSSINLPQGLKTIGGYVFAGTELTEITIPASVERIGYVSGWSSDSGDMYSAYLFYNCKKLKKVVFEANGKLKELSMNFFSGCSALEEVVLPDALETIGSNSFASCGLTSLTIPASVKTIEINAFAASANLKTVTFEEGSQLEVIENQAFRNTALTSFTFPESDIPIELGEKLFLGCLYLTELHLSSKVTDIGDALVGCSSIMTVDIPEVNKNMSLESSSGGGGIIYNYNKTILKVFVGRWEEETFTVGAGVTNIESNAFAGQYRLKKVIIPDSVKTIGEQAFYNCINLETVEFPDYAQLTTIGKYAFSGCENLKTVKLPSNLAAIGTYAFAYSGIESIDIPASVKTLGNYAFSNASKLKTVTGMQGLTTFGMRAFEKTGLTTFNVPDTIKSLGNYVFSDCYELVTVTGMKNVAGKITGTFQYCYKLESVPSLAKVTELGGSTFYKCYALKTVDLPAVTKMASSEFWGAASLTSVTGTNKLTAIGDTAFSGCTSLESIDLSNVQTLGADKDEEIFKGAALKEVDLSSVKTMGQEIFINNTSLTKVTFGKDLTKIPSGSFTGCSALTSVVIPDTLTEIGARAFKDCTSLASVKLGEKTTTILNNAFNGCSSLVDINLGKVTKLDGASIFTGCASLKSVDLNSLVIDSASLSGSSYAFDGCVALKSVTLGDNVKAIHNYMFRNCSSLNNVDLTNIQKIGSEAFYGCSALTNVVWAAKSVSADGTETFVGKISDIGESAFQNCISLASVDLSALTSLDSLGEFAFGGCSALSFAKMPDSLVTISDNAFAGTALTTFEFTKSIDINKLGVNVFADTNIASFTVAENAKEFSIVDGALFNANGEILYAYPVAKVPGEGTETAGVYTLDKDFIVGAFSGVKGITKLVIGDKVDNIADNAFASFASLREVVIPASVVSIGKYAFNDCANLTSVTFTGTSELKTIGQNAFSGTAKLESIQLPATLESIGNNAFEASSLKSIIIPETCVSLGTSLFYNCANLATVTLPSTLTALSDRMFFGCSSLAAIDLPSTLTTVGNYAFQRSGLVSIILPEGVTSLMNGTYGGYLFSGCEALTSVTILGEITEIPNDTFSGCTALETVLFKGQTASTDKTVIIPDTITKIGDRSFKQTDIRGVVIPDSVVNLGTNAPSYNEDYYKSYAPFGECANLKKVVLNASKLTTGVFAFADCPMLEEVVFGDNVETLGMSGSTYINKYMFSNCAALKTVDLGGLTYLPNYMFYGCTSLETITVPSTVKVIGEYAFAKSGVKNITLSEGITNIGNYAFMDCVSLENIVIPSTVEYFTYYASSYAASNTASYYTFKGCANLKNVEFKCDVPFIGGYMFAGCVNLENIKFKNTPEGKTGLYIPETTIVNKCAFLGLPSTKTLVLNVDFYDVSAAYAYNKNGTNWYTESEITVVDKNGERIYPRP